MRQITRAPGIMPMQFAPFQRQTALRTSLIQAECTSHAKSGLMMHRTELNSRNGSRAIFP